MDVVDWSADLWQACPAKDFCGKKLHLFLEISEKNHMSDQSDQGVTMSKQVARRAPPRLDFRIPFPVD